MDDKEDLDVRRVTEESDVFVTPCCKDETTDEELFDDGKLSCDSSRVSDLESFVKTSTKAGVTFSGIVSGAWPDLTVNGNANFPSP